MASNTVSSRLGSSSRSGMRNGMPARRIVSLALTSRLPMAAGDVKNAEAILSTPGVDGCWIGPSDLALSYGIHPRDRFTSDVHAKAVEKTLQACKNTGKFAGYATSGPNEALALAARGFQFLTVGSDAGFILKGIAQELQELGIDPSKQEAY